MKVPLESQDNFDFPSIHPPLERSTNTLCTLIYKVLTISLSIDCQSRIDEA